MKRGAQTATAASLVATIAGLIILYILFLPPSERADLLGETPSGTSGAGSSTGTSGNAKGLITNETIFKASPGKIYYQKLDEYEYDLPAFTLFKTTGGSVITNINSFRVRNGAFDKSKKNITFNIKEVANVDNVMLSFNAIRHTGTLTIRLNGAEIYQFEVDKTTPDPISLDKAGIAPGKNMLEFSVSGVGMQFWKTNEYSFSGMKITADVTDTSRQESKNSFYISPEESGNMQKAQLKFNPDCRTSEAGVLEVTVNGKSIFSGVPDCGSLNTYDISPSQLNAGRNTVNFRTDRGSYLVDHIQVRTELKEPIQPTYYFDIEDKYFRNIASTEERCGEYDGICPDNCGKELDYDCCFEENPQGFWCDVKTNYIGDRCVGFVEENQCTKCQSGYEDSDGKSPEACKKKCGDDNDDSCPSGCKAKYDKDCCFDKPGNQYFCNDLPITGEDFTCMDELTQSTCQNCPTGYVAEGTNFNCDKPQGETEAKLKSGLGITLIFRFTESREDKEAEIWINGKQTSFATRESSFRRNINEFIEPGTNSILIRPKTDLNIRELEVKFD
jgi:hypothetical protein